MATPRTYALAVPIRMFAVAMVVGVLTARSAFLGAPTVLPGETSGTRTPEDDGYPIIFFPTSKGFAPGPANGPRSWQTLRWTGHDWVRRPFTTSGNNYDHGSLYIEPDGAWRVIAPTEAGPQPFNPGGEMMMWLTRDQGATWTKLKQLTRGSKFNHTYARRPLHAHPEFYALWADGHARQPSESSLYFTDKEGTHVWRLPAKMEGEVARPEVAW